MIPQSAFCSSGRHSLFSQCSSFRYMVPGRNADSNLFRTDTDLLYRALFDRSIVGCAERSRSPSCRQTHYRPHPGPAM
jgi:hypothetical protein